MATSFSISDALRVLFMFTWDNNMQDQMEHPHTWLSVHCRLPQPKGHQWGSVNWTITIKSMSKKDCPRLLWKIWTRGTMNGVGLDPHVRDLMNPQHINSDEGYEKCHSMTRVMMLWRFTDLDFGDDLHRINLDNDSQSLSELILVVLSGIAPPPPLTTLSTCHPPYVFSSSDLKTSTGRWRFEKTRQRKEVFLLIQRYWRQQRPMPGRHDHSFKWDFHCK